MTRTILSKGQLNRTLLHRQLLLERHDLSAEAATECLIALQSQIPNPPYIGLWTRLRDFERDELNALQEPRRLVRTHGFARHCILFRPLTISSFKR